ncbi:hypothetical protein [Alicyclobacillus fastidiosus]|uniref:Uncharacterized protein n=1 Tax=Alicyclobacillus fastidiosus TaxID=392011 RepID=A0ABV5AJM6_9BACL|nr:hypothetical protein [Alicyclobacillus fastidiosus]WEH10049.1 hypothetical protein PYS47_01805 [Alicyclobacillus fastidiosus]WEH10073.1 hypothetical protein PYS47_01970 [Alicyclobacillus fastidiosus]
MNFTKRSLKWAGLGVTGALALGTVVGCGTNNTPSQSSNTGTSGNQASTNQTATNQTTSNATTGGQQATTQTNSSTQLYGVHITAIFQRNGIGSETFHIQ